MKYLCNTLRLSLTLLLFILILSVMPTLAHGPGGTQEGWFSVLHWIPEPGSRIVANNIYVLSFDDGHRLTLDIPDDMLKAAGGLQVLKNRRVRVALTDENARSGSRVGVNAIELAPLPLIMPNESSNPAPRAVTGSQPWVTLLCKFPDVGNVPEPLSYFEAMYSEQYPGMDHYWRQQSFGKVNLLGSETYGWFNLPKNRNQYVQNDPMTGADVLLLDLADDCLNAADASVDFSAFMGINFMFNGTIGCCAWGGGYPFTLDGANKFWRLTWNPPWAWRDITVVAHEVGHGFGLPHANNYDNDNDPYDSPWDVMSDTQSFCNRLNDPTYGCLGQHTSAYHKDTLGWFNPAQRLTATYNTGAVTLDHVAMQNAQNTQIILIPIPGSAVFYTVEARQTENSNYDAKLPGKAVIIHEVDESRQESAWLVGGTTDGLSASVTTNIDGAWLVGEEFTGPNFTLTIDSETLDGFVVSVTFDESNLLINGGMEGGSSVDNLPNGWTGKGLTGDKIRCNTAEKTFAFVDNCAFRFKGSVGENSSLRQTISLIGRSFTSGDTLQVSGFLNASNTSVAGKVMLKVTYSDGTKGKAEAIFAPTSGYQPFEAALDLAGGISKIQVQVQHKSTAGKVLLDGMNLMVNP